MDPEMKAIMRYYVNLYLVSQIWPCGRFLLMNFVLIIVHATQNQYGRIWFIMVPFNILAELLDWRPQHRKLPSEWLSRTLLRNLAFKLIYFCNRFQMGWIRNGQKFIVSALSPKGVFVLLQIKEKLCSQRKPEAKSLQCSCANNRGTLRIWQGRFCAAL